MKPSATKQTGFIALMVVQIILVGLFWLFVHYDKKETLNVTEDTGLYEEHVSKYPKFQNIQVMVFIGFGFLMTFLRKYGYSATGYTLFMSALVIQWAILVKGFFHLDNGKIHLSLENLIDADIAAVVPLISMGALLGRLTPVQLLFMALFEVALFAGNEYIALNILSICDVGGSITVHAFGAYFGLVVSLLLRPNKMENETGKYEGANYTSDLFAMIGTLFLWIYWPSFNSILAVGHSQERAILNTYLSLAAATVTTFILSSLISREKKLDMVHIQNSTLAGGVAVGTVCNLMIGAHGAVIIGIIASIISVMGYRYITPTLTSKLRLHDTCGVHNLHGMPALLSATASIIYAFLATKEQYKSDLNAIFPAMLNRPENINSTMIWGGYERTATAQAGFQLCGIAITIVVAIVGGVLAGTILKSTGFRKLTKEEQYQDELYWEVAEPKDEYQLHPITLIRTWNYNQSTPKIETYKTGIQQQLQQ